MKSVIGLRARIEKGCRIIESIVMGADECILLGVMDTITLTEGDTRVEIAPARGALVTRLVVKGQELLYLDRATLDDPSKNVRGGIPVLFPFAGRLDGEGSRTGWRSSHWRDETTASATSIAQP